MKSLTSTFLGILLVVACKQNPENSTTTFLQQSKPGRAVSDDKENEWIREKIDSTMRANNVPALSVGVIRDGKLSFLKGFGVKERDDTTKVDENSIYQIASDTKKLTGIVVNNLVLEGKLNVEESIITYLPDKLTDKAKEKLKNVTVKDLLRHRSGLPYRAPSNQRIDGDPMLIEYTEQDLIKDLNELELEFEPGTEFSYSNLGYGVVGYILEKVSGQDYSTLLKKYITDKYSLANTFVEPDENQKSLIATPYRKDDRNIKTQPFVMGKLTPAGGVYSNIIDLSKLMMLQIKAYRQFNQSGNKDNSLILTENAGIDDSDYGYGLAKKVDENGTRYGHGGDLDGFASGYVFSPEKNAGIILLTTSGGRWFGQLEGEIRKKLFEESDN